MGWGGVLLTSLVLANIVDAAPWMGWGWGGVGFYRLFWGLRLWFVYANVEMSNKSFETFTPEKQRIRMRSKL